MRRRSTSRLVGGGSILVGVLAAALVVAAVPHGEQSTTRITPRKVDTSTDSTPLDRQPSYLPKGAVRLPDPEGLQNVTRRVTLYSLPGSVNAHTIPSGGSVADLSADSHPATELHIRVEVGASGLVKPQRDRYWTVTPITVGPFSGWQSTFITGYGNRAITWSDGSYTYTVSSPRYRTRSGPSGIPLEELQQVAASMTG